MDAIGHRDCIATHVGRTRMDGILDRGSDREAVRNRPRSPVNSVGSLAVCCVPCTFVGPWLRTPSAADAVLLCLQCSLMCNCEDRVEIGDLGAWAALGNPECSLSGVNSLPTVEIDELRAPRDDRCTDIVALGVRCREQSG